MGFGYRIYTGLGKKKKRLSKGTNKTFVHQGPGSRNSDPQETEPELPVSVQEFLVEARVNSGLPQGQGTGYIPGSLRVLT